VRDAAHTEPKASEGREGLAEEFEMMLRHNDKHIPETDYLDVDDEEFARYVKRVAPAILAALREREATAVGETVLDEEWQRLLEKDDRTSPEDCPDMCLISKQELWEAMSAALAKASAVQPGGERLQRGGE